MFRSQYRNDSSTHVEHATCDSESHCDVKTDGDGEVRDCDGDGYGCPETCVWAGGLVDDEDGECC